jgi:hypothetical protein
VVFPLPWLPVLLGEETITRTSIGAGTKEFKDFFVDLAFGRMPFNISIMTDDKRQFIKSIIVEISGLRKVGLEVVRALERILIISSPRCLMKASTIIWL